MKYINYKLIGIILFIGLLYAGSVSRRSKMVTIDQPSAYKVQVLEPLPSREIFMDDKGFYTYISSDSGAVRVPISLNDTIK